MSAKPNLRIIDTETGEVKGTCPECERQAEEIQRLEDQISGLQRDIRGWAARYAELKRDKAAAAKNHPLYADAETAFRHWQWKCSHPRSGFTTDRFWLIVPFLENPKYGLKICMKAIEGAAYDPFEVKRKNGSIKRFDEWERIFESTGNVEDFANRAPRGQQELSVG